jgi:alkanesulfonate monooxygenase SsuD/methylene tetrahydromethanopterin reductase-like flavin-dependent oxidoreductase (luciferase family)
MNPGSIAIGGYRTGVSTPAPRGLADRFGILVNNFTFGLPSDRLFAQVVDIAAAVESTGFDTMWVPDHLVQGPVGDVNANTGGVRQNGRGPDGPHTPIFDAPTLLAALAVTTERVHLGPLVSPVTIRHPGVLAKSITTTDVVAGGRAVLGIGAAWDGDEHQRYGLEFPPPGERVTRLADAVQICRAMFDEEAASHAGEHFSIAGAYNVPRPVSERIPILVGGAGARTLRIAAEHADACNPIGETDDMRRAFELVERYCDELGRDPSEVSKQSGIMFHRIDDLYRKVEEAFAIGSDGVILVPWQLALTPDQIAAVGDRLTAEFA